MNQAGLSQQQKDAGIQILGFNSNTRDLRFVDHLHEIYGENNNDN